MRRESCPRWIWLSIRSAVRVGRDLTRRCAERGQLFVYGISAMLGKDGPSRATAIGSFHAARLVQRPFRMEKSAHFYAITTMKKEHPEWFREDLANLLDLLATRKITPMIADRLPLAQASHAHELLQSGQTTGKLVLLPQ